MGYSIEAILTNSRQVRKVVGSKDITYLDSIRYDPDEEYDFYLEDYFDLSSGELSTKQLMANIIIGDMHTNYLHLQLDKTKEKFALSAIGAVYSYLERDMHRHFGKTINRNADGWPMLTEYLEDFEPRSRPWFTHPVSRDFPHVYSIGLSEVETYKPLYVQRLKEKFPNTPELIEDLEFIFGEMQKEKMGLFLVNS
ncbi:hypothetical protein [Aquimarina sp. SS2-1]|uniref:hypothetical protein n=1 Tax=Aquimarina besae TaxID=3342247 RepID=UPI00366E9C83